MKFETCNGIWINHRFVVTYYFNDGMFCCKDVNGHFFNIVKCDNIDKLEQLVQFMENSSITLMILKNEEIKYYVDRL